MATSSPSQPKATRSKSTTKTNGAPAAVPAEEAKNSTPVTASASATARPTSDDVARRAYEIYEREGRQPGTELQNWLKAEAELGLSKSH